MLDGDLTTIALCWRIERRDGVTIGLTDHDRDLVIDGLVHRLQHNWVLAHAQIVVAAPDGDVTLGPVRPGPDGVGKHAIATFDIDKGTIAAFFM